MQESPLIDAFDVIHLGQRPGGYDFAGFVNELLHAHARKLGIPGDSVRTILRTDISDGGVDAEVIAAAPHDPEGLLDNKTIWQHKASPKERIRLEGKDGIKAEMQKQYAMLRLREGYAYRLCVCNSFPPKKIAAWEAQLTSYLREKLGRADAPAVKVLGADALAAWANQYPEIATKVFHKGGPTPQPLLFVDVPSPPTSFSGREAELELLRHKLGIGILPPKRTVAAICGMGGVGKSSLASVVAYDSAVLQHFTGGVLWAGLGEIPSLANILSLWARALQVTYNGTTDEQGQLIRAAIGMRPCLIILDDVWTIDEIDKLLQIGGPRCAYLLTTRSLDIAQELDPDVLQLSELSPDDAEKLLISLCPQAQSYRERLAGLSQAVGYLPLALSLIGGQLRTRIVFPSQAEAVVSGLRQTEQWLGLTDRKQNLTIEQVITRSIDALSDDALYAFINLAAFAAKPASFGLEDALITAGAESETIGLLVRLNLLEQMRDERLRIHQTISAVVRLQAVRLEILNEASRKHAEYYYNRLEGKRGRWQAVEQDWPQIEHGWQWLKEQRSPQFVYYTNEAMPYYLNRGMWDYVASWCEAGLDVAHELKMYWYEASMLQGLGRMSMNKGAWEEARGYFGQATSICQQYGDQVGAAIALHHIALTYIYQGEPLQAVRYIEQAHNIYQQTGSDEGELSYYNDMALVYKAVGETNKALEYYIKAMDVCTSSGNTNSYSDLVANIANTLADMGDKKQAEEYYKLSLADHRERGDREGVANVQNGLGLLYSSLADWDAACQCYMEALTIFAEIGNQPRWAAVLSNIGIVCHANKMWSEALEFYRIALTVQEQLQDKGGMMATLSNTALTRYELGEWQVAYDTYQKVLGLMEETGNSHKKGAVLNNIGLLYDSIGDLEQALSYYSLASETCQKSGDADGHAVALYHIGHSLLRQGNIDDAVRQLEQAKELAVKLPYPALLQQLEPILVYAMEEQRKALH